MFQKIISLCITFSLLTFLAASPAHAGKHDPLYTPEEIQVPGGKNSGDVKKIMMQALLQKGWEMREVGPGRLQGMHTKSGRHTAIIDINYDARAIRITYSDSENLNFNKNNNTIHGTYNKWVRNAEKYIRTALSAN